MEIENNQEDFVLSNDLERFVKVYISEAITAAKEKPSVDRFQERVHKQVANKVGISEQDVLNLHHPLFWAFFCYEPDSPKDPKVNSPLKFNQSEKVGGENYISQIDRATKSVKNGLYDVVRKKYGEYITAASKSVRWNQEAA